jgi:hypothetical protein
MSCSFVIEVVNENDDQSNSSYFSFRTEEFSLFHLLKEEAALIPVKK